MSTPESSDNIPERTAHIAKQAKWIRERTIQRLGDVTTTTIEGASRDALLIKHVPWLLEQVHDLYEENSRLREALHKCNGQHYEHVVDDGPSF